MKTFPLLTVAMVALSGCQDSTKVAELERRIVELESSTKNLGDRLSTAQVDMILLTMDGQAVLKPGDTGYSAIKFDLGYLTTGIKDIKPYANGTKLSIQFGNISSARLNGLKGTVAWGKLDKNGVPIVVAEKTKQFSFVAPITAGSWSDSEIVLDNTPPQELQFIRVSDLTHQGIGLKNN